LQSLPPPRVGARPGTENKRAMHGVECDVPHASTDTHAVAMQKAVLVHLYPNPIHSCALVMMCCVTSHASNASPAKGSLRTSLPILVCARHLVTRRPSQCHAGDGNHMLLLRSIADSLQGTYAAGATHHAWGHFSSPLPSFGFCFDVPQVVSSLDAFLAIRALP
jgi:hypothetical protein